jgi:hypothetical protein
MKSYLAKYIAAGAGLPGSGEAALLGFFSNLDLSDWEAFLIDLGMRRAEAFEIIQPRAPETLIPMAQDFLGRTSPAAKGLAGQALTRILTQLLARHRQPEDDVAFLDLLAVASSFPYSAAVLRKIVHTVDAGPDLRTEAARALSNINEEPPAFWLEIDYHELPGVAPIALEVLSSTMPLQALGIFTALREPPTFNAALLEPLGIATTQLLSLAGGSALLLDLLAKSPAWARAAFAEVLDGIDVSRVPEIATRGQEAANLVRILHAQNLSARAPEPVKEPSLEILGAMLAQSDKVLALLERWSPVADASTVSLAVILELFVRHPSLSAFSALITIARFYLAEIRAGDPMLGSRSNSAGLVISALVRQDHVARAGRQHDSTVWDSFRQLLLSALEVAPTAVGAFEALLAQGTGPRMVASVMLRVARARSMAFGDCYELLSTRRDSRFAMKVLRAAVREARTMGSLEEFGAQLYDYSPQIFDELGRDLAPREEIAILARAERIDRYYQEDPHGLDLYVLGLDGKVMRTLPEDGRRSTL